MRAVFFRETSAYTFVRFDTVRPSCDRYSKGGLQIGDFRSNQVSFDGIVDLLNRFLLLHYIVSAFLGSYGFSELTEYKDSLFRDIL